MQQASVPALFEAPDEVAKVTETPDYRGCAECPQPGNNWTPGKSTLYALCDV